MSRRDFVVTIILILIVYVLIIIQASAIAAPINSGDPNGSGSVNMADVIYLIQYIFDGGPEPTPMNCPTVYFLFDDVIPQVVETYYLDTNWIHWDIGDRRFFRSDNICRRIFSVGPDSQPTWYYLVPDTAVWGQTNTVTATVTRVYLNSADSASIVDSTLEGTIE